MQGRVSEKEVFTEREIQTTVAEPLNIQTILITHKSEEIIQSQEKRKHLKGLEEMGPISCTVPGRVLIASSQTGKFHSSWGIGYSIQKNFFLGVWNN